MREGMDLLAEAHSVASARRFVRRALEGSGDGVAAHQVDTAVLLVSELATNAVLHARSDFRVVVETEATVVRISVLDRSPVLVHRRVNGVHAATGRGLALVETMAERWGPTGSDALEGYAKGVWFELAPGQVPVEDEGALYGEAWLSLVEDL